MLIIFEELAIWVLIIPENRAIFSAIVFDLMAFLDHRNLIFQSFHRGCNNHFVTMTQPFHRDDTIVASPMKSKESHVVDNLSGLVTKFRGQDGLKSDSGAINSCQTGVGGG